MDAHRKREVEAQLRGAGYAIPEAMRFTQGKVTMYRHKPMLNVEGQIVKPCGDVAPNQPNHPDHKARLVMRGLRDWPFRGVCICNPCVCREKMGIEGFEEAMKRVGLDPDKVMPQGAIQAVTAPKPDTKPMPVVANADVANAEVEAIEHVKVGDGKCKCGWTTDAKKKSTRSEYVRRHIRAVAKELVAV